MEDFGLCSQEFMPSNSTHGFGKDLGYFEAQVAEAAVYQLAECHQQSVQTHSQFAHQIILSTP
jgi:hypothetical protein